MQVSCRPILLNDMKVSVQGSTALTVSQLRSDSSFTLLMSLQDDLKIYSAQAVIGCSVSNQLIDVGNYVQFSAAAGSTKPRSPSAAHSFAATSYPCRTTLKRLRGTR